MKQQELICILKTTEYCSFRGDKGICLLPLQSEYPRCKFNRITYPKDWNGL